MDDKKISEIVEAVKRRLSEGGGDTLYGSESISLCAAKRLADAVEKEACRIGVRPVVAVANAGGNIILVHSADDAYIASFDVAVSKAYTSVALKMTTSELKTLANPGGELYGIQFTSPGKIAVFGGGNPLYGGSRVVGGLGVSGGTEEQDTYLSAFGARLFEEGLS